MTLGPSVALIERYDAFAVDLRWRFAGTNGFDMAGAPCVDCHQVIPVEPAIDTGIRRQQADIAIIIVEAAVIELDPVPLFRPGTNEHDITMTALEIAQRARDSIVDGHFLRSYACKVKLIMAGWHRNQKRAHQERIEHLPTLSSRPNPCQGCSFKPERQMKRAPFVPRGGNDRHGQLH